MQVEVIVPLPGNILKWEDMPFSFHFVMQVHDVWSWHSPFGSWGCLWEKAIHIKATRHKEPGPWRHARHTSLVCPSVGFSWRKKYISILFKTPLRRFVFVFFLFFFSYSWQIWALMWYKDLKNMYSIPLPFQVGQVSLWGLLVSFSVLFSPDFLPT